MEQTTWKTMLHHLVEEEEGKGRRKISLELEREFSRSAGKIVYHNPNMWTLSVNPHVLPVSESAGSGKLKSRYLFSYIAAHLRMADLAMQERPDTYRRGLAILSHIGKREKNKVVILESPRDFPKSFRRRGTVWMPDDLCCDCEALRETYEYADSYGTEKAQLQQLEQITKEAELLSLLPEVIYKKKGIPSALSPVCAQDWMELLSSGKELRKRYPVLEPLFTGEKETTGEKVGLMVERLLETGGGFYGILAIHLLACGIDEQNYRDTDCFLEELGLSLSETLRLRLCQAAEEYRKESRNYLIRTSGFPSKILMDNRIAVERTVEEINCLMRKLHLRPQSGIVHSLGYH